MKKTIICITAAMTMSSSFAQSLHEEHIDSLISSTKVIDLDDSPLSLRSQSDEETRRMIESFYYEQFRHSQDPDAPYFLFMSKSGQLSMGIGGVVRMRAWFDWGGAIPVSSFTPYLIPMIPNPTARQQLGTTPAGVCLYFRTLGRSPVIGNYQLYIEANFNGYQGRDFHLKKAYAVVRDITVGYTSSTFSDPAALPPMVDAAGTNDKIDGTTVLLRYMPQIAHNFHAALSIESPNVQADVDRTTTAKCTSFIPDIAALIQYEWNKGQHVRLAGIIRSLPYRNLLSERNHTPIGAGISLSSVARLLPQFTTYTSVSYGKGISSLGGDLLVGNYDLLADPTEAGSMYAPRSLGWHVGVQYNIRPNLYIVLTASQMRLLPSHSVAADEYKYGLLGVISAFWHPIPRLQIGTEFDFGKRQNFSGAHRYARRFGALCQFSF